MSTYEPELLRVVGMKIADNEYRLELYDLHREDRYGKSLVSGKLYALTNPSNPIFDGCVMACSPLHAIDSLATMREMLGFLTTRPGDTDREYFDSYTAIQLEFADSSDCEYMQMYATEYDPTPFDYDDFDLS